MLTIQSTFKARVCNFFLSECLYSLFSKKKKIVLLKNQTIHLCVIFFNFQGIPPFLGPSSCGAQASSLKYQIRRFTMENRQHQLAINRPMIVLVLDIKFVMLNASHQMKTPNLFACDGRTLFICHIPSSILTKIR